MLAVQRPSMGSSKPPNLEMPFGYSFDDSGTNHRFPSPTAPAPGPSILDDNESRFLDSFFDGLNSDQISYNLFNIEDGANMGIGWEELPGNFLGNTSSFGQHTQSVTQGGLMGIDFGQINSRLVPDTPITPTATNEMLQAASILQSVPNTRSHGLDDGEYLRNREVQFLPGDRLIGPGIMSRPFALLQPVTESRPSGECYTNEPVHTDVIFDAHSNALIRNRGVIARPDIRWGSDAAFTAPQGFITPSGQESISAAERYQIHAIETALSLSPNPIPPAMICQQRPAMRKSSISHQRGNSIGHNCVEVDQSLLTNKRRKVEVQEEEEEEDLKSPSLMMSKTIAKKRKAGVRETAESSVIDYESSHKRRRSTTSAGGKSTRENLTEEQKRENHIKSEQKRRTLIREGFEDLNELVPGLQGGGYSKSAVLAQAADWLEDLIRGNEKLRTKILILEERVANKAQ